MPLRILHISTRLILGGSQENTVLSCEGQARRGHEVHLAFGPIHGPEGSLLERVRAFRTDDGRGITTHVVPHMVREVNSIADWRAGRELRRLIGALRPDVVHTHSSKAGILGRLAAWAVDKRDSDAKSWGFRDHEVANTGIVHTIHGPPFMPVEGSALARAKTRAMNAAYTIAERRAARRCDLIVSVADAMTREFRRRGIGRDGQYVTVRSGMETGALLHAEAGQERESVRRSLGIGDGDFVIGTVARLAQHKGHADILAALVDDLPAHPSWRLLWVGDGWLKEELTGLARRMGLGVREVGAAHGGAPYSPSPVDAGRQDRGGQLLLTGLARPERVPGLIRAMDVLVHPSSREGLPRTVPQALLCGVMPIAYDADGTGEVCREMETGRLVRVGDLAGLREAVRWAAENPAARAELAARGREECRGAFAAETMVDRLEEAYAEARRRANAEFR